MTAPTSRTGIAHVNGIDLWFEWTGEEAPATAVLISGAGRTCARWSPALIEGLLDLRVSVLRFDNRDVGLSTHINLDDHP